MKYFHFRHAFLHIGFDDTRSRIFLSDELLDFVGQYAAGVISGSGRVLLHRRQFAGGGNLYFHVTHDRLQFEAVIFLCRSYIMVYIVHPVTGIFRSEKRETGRNACTACFGSGTFN